MTFVNLHYTIISRKDYFYDTEAEREALAENLYITAVIVGPKGFVGRYRKRNLTNDEKIVYTRGKDSRIIDSNREILINAFGEEKIISYEISKELSKIKKLPDSDNLLEEIMCYSF